MTTTDATAATADNGVNVQALLDARDALSEAPEGAKFTWKATTEWKRGTHSSTSIADFYGLGTDQAHRTTFTYSADHPEIFASEDHGPTPVEFVLVGLASCLTAGVASVAQNRDVNGGSGSWRSALTFSDEGCWRLTGRVGDVSLSYVVRVVAAP